MPLTLVCSVCNKTPSSERKMQRCSRCPGRFYCGTDCQSSDWPTHRQTCGATQSVPWYDKYRKCKDGSLHEGKLELITWNSTDEDEEMGWGNTLLEEAADLKAKFEGEFRGNPKKLYRYWPQAFRWTCCGMDAGMKWGCDHHGKGSKPCSCDFCKMGKPIPDSIYNKESTPRVGLNLPRGPDPRSFNPAQAAIANAGRTMLGLEM